MSSTAKERCPEAIDEGIRLLDLLLSEADKAEIKAVPRATSARAVGGLEPQAC